MAKNIEKFVKYWFLAMDSMEEFEYFIPYLDRHLEIKDIHETFVGIDGLKKWYGGLREIVMPNNTHTITDLHINEIDSDKGMYNVSFQSTVKADTFQGGKLHMQVKENWIVSFINEQIHIIEYAIFDVKNLN